eukprot:IDg10630t1
MPKTETVSFIEKIEYAMTHRALFRRSSIDSQQCPKYTSRSNGIRLHLGDIRLSQFRNLQVQFIHSRGERMPVDRRPCSEVEQKTASLKSVCFACFHTGYRRPQCPHLSQSLGALTRPSIGFGDLSLPTTTPQTVRPPPPQVSAA